MQQYQHPITNHIETDGSNLAWLGAFAFGPLYFLARNNWAWFFIYLIATFFTYGIALLIVPFLVRGINAQHLLKQGYRPIG